MLTRLKRIFFVDPPRPALEEGEEIILEGTAVHTQGLHGATTGPLILTNRRLIWQDSFRRGWPFKPISGQLDLSDIRSVDKGTPFDWVGGGPRLRLRLRNGKDKCFFDNGELEKWVTAIRTSLAAARQP